MAVIDSAYQYYLSNYGNSTVSRYDSHKKSQLRDVYNQIIKSTKESPLYKFNEDKGEVAKYAIDIKESARSIQNIISSLSDSASVFSKKIAQSSDEDILTAEYIGDDSDTYTAAGFDIEIKQLASPQINIGQFLSPDSLDINPGTYRFDLNTSVNSYEFQFTVNPNDTNIKVQQRLAKLINNSGIGVNASVNFNLNEKNALSIASKQTGLEDGEDSLFEILPGPDTDSIRAMRALGINEVNTPAQNSIFLLNGVMRNSFSNTFTVNNDFEVTLHDVSKAGTSSRVDFKTNADAITDNINGLVTAYNDMIEIGKQHAAKISSKLSSDVGKAASDYYNELESIGLAVQSDRTIQIDKNLLSDAITASDAETAFEVLNNFKTSLNLRTSKAIINPMDYIDKVVVIYKNPGHNFATPYLSSLYSGMMLDAYY